MPRGTLDMAINGEGALGVALSRASDGYRVLTLPARAERFWDAMKWPASTLAPFVGEKLTLDIFDYRCCAWGWLAVRTAACGLVLYDALNLCASLALLRRWIRL
jgi:hypothetical protein